ncbi:hypothetical protein H5410_040326 [Solanum commersonii]|uniref:Uncharacterized protein n=1 Tax=Solanum commersonii TaxID=4109 RepID=A0A9J5XR22_SOLCO|nr:hypothetical protein H5410_040326 [Solanum commersonii]
MKRNEHYFDLIKRVKSKLHAWKGNMLSYGGKEVLINSALQSAPIHILSAIVPPICVLKELHIIFTKRNWSNKVTGKSKHWAAWNEVCLPKQEGSLGFRSMFDLSQALYAKLWWKFRTQKSLWTNFMWNKYGKKQIPSLVQWKGGSQIWKNMLMDRDIFEHSIWWEPRGSTSSIWFDNWTKQATLFLQPTEVQTYQNLTYINTLISENGWNYKKMMKHLPPHVVDHVKLHIDQIRQPELSDKPW